MPERENFALHSPWWSRLFFLGKKSEKRKLLKFYSCWSLITPDVENFPPQETRKKHNNHGSRGAVCKRNIDKQCACENHLYCMWTNAMGKGCVRSCTVFIFEVCIRGCIARLPILSSCVKIDLFLKTHEASSKNNNKTNFKINMTGVAPIIAS